MAWFDGFVENAPGKLVRTVEGTRAFLPARLPATLDLPAEVHRLVAHARAKLGRLEGIGSLSSNPALFVRNFQTREAAASSRIEGTKTTNEEALANQVPGIGTADDPDAREVDNYLRALQQGVKALQDGRKLSRSLFFELHATLLAGVRGHRTVPGRFREKQVFVGASERIQEARFVPPPALHVPQCIADLLDYLDARSDDDPLVRAALVHYQFEAIHPFEDGNGRIGRLLVALQTIQEGLQHQPLLYVSSRLEAKRQEYYDRLLAVSSKGDFVGWVRFFVRVMIESAEETTDKIQRLVAVIRRFREQLHGCSTANPVRLVDRLEEHPYLTVATAKKHLQVNSTATAQAAINVLEGAHIVARAKVSARTRGRGRPAVLYHCPAILRILRT
jgi:Fic family protein